MSHWGYVIEEITHGHESEEERRSRRLRARARRDAPRREGRWAAWMKGSGQGVTWTPQRAETAAEVSRAPSTSPR